MNVRRYPVTDDLGWCDECQNYHLPNQHDAAVPSGDSAACRECGVEADACCADLGYPCCWFCTVTRVAHLPTASSNGDSDA